MFIDLRRTAAIPNPKRTVARPRVAIAIMNWATTSPVRGRPPVPVHGIPGCPVPLPLPLLYSQPVSGEATATSVRVAVGAVVLVGMGVLVGRGVDVFGGVVVGIGVLVLTTEVLVGVTEGVQM